MKILFIDTETNGLPIDYKASYTDVNNWPRVIALGWILADETGKILRESHELVLPNGWQVPTEEFWVKNGYRQDINQEKGIAIEVLLDALMEAKLEADLLVAHNLNFDHRIVWAEFIRSGKQPRSGMHKVCTMMKTTSVCKIPNTNRRGFKWPKLEELYEFLFKKKLGDAHQVSSDVTACMECFYKLVEMGVIKLSDYVPVVDDFPFN